MFSAQLQALHILRSIRVNFQRRMEPILREADLSLIQILLLLGISSGDIENVNGVCRVLELGQGNASTLCKKMEQSGLLLRERSRQDERVVQLSLTQAGEEKVQTLLQEIDRRWGQVHRDHPALVRQLMEGLAAADALLRLPEEQE
ncbi:MAG: winged helix DNA-binding protein [Bacillota bacterium]|nr:winged helix DNA-binding protein [Bacillota bacterium]